MTHPAAFRRPRFAVLSILLGAALFLAGCNAFGTGNTSGGDTVEELVADADVALSEGDYDSAVSSLEKAYDKEPENAEVRIKLSNALYGQANLSSIELRELSDLATDLSNNRAKRALNAKSHGGEALVCSVDAAEPRPTENGYELIDLRSNEVLTTLNSEKALIDRVGNDLVSEGLITADTFDDLTVTLRQNAFLNAAFTNVFAGIQTVYSEGLKRDAHVYSKSNSTDEVQDVIVCAPTQEDLDALECEDTYKKNLVGENSLLSTAVSYLQLRDEILGAETSNLTKALEDLTEAVENNIDEQSCSASTTAFADR